MAIPLPPARPTWCGSVQRPGDDPMTPEERNLVSDLFGRLAAVENTPRDPDAERVIRDVLRQAHNALYALVQTTLLQDAALKHADERIRALEAQAAGSS